MGSDHPFADRIPADSPAVLLTSDLSIVAEEARGREPAWRELHESGQFAPGAPMRERLPLRERIALALIEQAGPDLDEASLGISREAAAAAYVDGDALVLRVEVAQPRVTAALVEALVAAHLGAARTLTIGDSVVHIAAAGPANELVAAVSDSELVCALVARGSSSAAAERLLGPRRPARSLRDSGRIRASARRHRLPTRALAVVDSAGLLDALVRIGWVPWSEADHPACVAELRALAVAAPQLLFGSDRKGDTRASVLAVDLRHDLAEELTQLASSVPGIAPEATRGSVLAIAVGARIGRVVAALRARLTTLERQPRACPLLAPLNQLPELASPFLRVAGSDLLEDLTGASFIASAVRRGEDGQLEAIRGVAFVGTSETRALLARLASMLGLKAALISSGGQPVPIEVPGLEPFAPIHIGSTERAIGVSFGEGSVRDLGALLGRDPAVDPPLLVVRAELAEIAGREGSLRGSALLVAAANPPLRQALLDLDAAARRAYGRVLIVLSSTRFGLALRVESTYAP